MPRSKKVTPKPYLLYGAIITGIFLILFFSYKLIVRRNSQSINLISSTSPLNGSFIYTQYLTIPEIKPLLEEIKTLKMDTVIIARTRLKSESCTSNKYKWDYGMGGTNALLQSKEILSQADALGLDVYIGLTQPSDVCPEFAGDTNRMQDVSDTTYALAEILKLGTHSSLKGWYIPVEPSLVLDWPENTMNQWYKYFKEITSAIKQQSNLPVIVSPMLCGAANKDPAIVASRALTFKNNTGVDIQAWQDGGNCTALNWQRPGFSPTYQLSDYMQALSSTIGRDSLWSNNELFGFSTPDPDPWKMQVGIDWDLYRPATFTRIKNQIIQSSPASRKVSWLQNTMLTKTAKGRFKESDRLFDTYAAYYGISNDYILPTNITWITPPASNYPDTNNQELFDGQTADNLNGTSPNWVGINGTTKFVATLPSSSEVFWVGVHLFHNQPASIRFPDSLILECSQDNASYASLGSWPLPVHHSDGDYFFANGTKLNASCKYLRVTLPNSGWTFLSELEIVGKNIPISPTPISTPIIAPSNLPSSAPSHTPTPSITPTFDPNTYNNQTIKKANDPATYLVVNGVRSGFPDWVTFLSKGYNQNDQKILADATVDSIPLGTSFPSIEGKPVKGTTDIYTVYLIENGQKRPFPDWETYISRFKDGDQIILSDKGLNNIPLGAPVPSVQ